MKSMKGEESNVKIIACQVREKRKRKAVYTTTSVTCGWAGEMMLTKKPFGCYLNCVTDAQTDRLSDGRTDGTTE